MSDGFTLKTRPVMDRFWIKVAVAGPGDCWEWTGKRKKRPGAESTLHAEEAGGMSPITAKALGGRWVGK